MSENNANLFKNEVNLMFELRHTHVVQIFGFVNEGLMLIMEFVEQGNLSDFLRNENNQEQLHWPKRIEFASQISKGMKNLTNNNAK